MPGAAARSAARRAVAHRLVRALHLPHGDRLDGGYSSRGRAKPSAGGQPAGTAPDQPAMRAANAAMPAAPQCHDGSARSRGRPPVAVLVPERPVPVATRAGAERRRAPTRAAARFAVAIETRARRDRRAPSRSRRRRCRGRRGPVRRGRRAARRHAPSGGPGVPQPDRRPAGDVEVPRVARGTGRVEVDPGDARGTELEARRAGGASSVAIGQRSPPERSGDRLLVHPVQQPARGARSAGSRSCR